MFQSITLIKSPLAPSYLQTGPSLDFTRSDRGWNISDSVREVKPTTEIQSWRVHLISNFANIHIINNEKVSWGYLYRTDYSSTFIFCFDDWTDCDFMRRFPGLYWPDWLSVWSLPFPPPPLQSSLPTLIDIVNQLTCTLLAALRYRKHTGTLIWRQVLSPAWSLSDRNY